MSTESGGSLASRWRVGDATARLLCDVVADRAMSADVSLSEDGLRLAYSHGLIGILADPVGPASLPQARPVYARLAARQQVMKTHLFEILTRLAEAGIPATVVKGPYLAHHVYRREMHRTYTDIDLLVPPDDVTATLDVMAATGTAYIPERRPKAEKRDVIFTDPSGVSFSVDLHWDLFSYRQLRGSADGAIAWAWDQGGGRIDSPLGPMWSIANQARLAFLCTHSLLDHRFRLILFRDLAEVARRGVDWKAFVTFAERWGLCSLTYLALLMARELADAPVPTPVLETLRTRNLPIRVAEALLPRTDLVRFRGDTVHPLNLAIVLTHDRARSRAILAAQAPFAYPGWRKRVEVRGRETIRGRLSDAPEPTILTVITTDRRRGAEVFGEQLTEGLRSRGWRTSLVSLSSTDDAEARVAAHPLGRVSPEELGKLSPGLVWSLRHRVQLERPQIVLANGSATLRYCVAALITMPARPVLVYTSIGEPGYWSRGPSHRWILRRLLARVDLVLAVSEETRRQLVNEFGIAANKVQVAHTGVPEQFLDVQSGDRALELRILFLGSLAEEKDPLAAVDVVAGLSGDAVPARLRFVGSGPLAERVSHEAERMGMSDRVELVGSVEDVRPHLGWADVLLLTSKTEGLPGAVLEAAASGVPAVAFDVGGTREAIVDGRSGLLVPPGDIEGAAQALARLAHDEPFRRALGKEARRLVKEHFRLDLAVDRYQQALAGAVAEASTGHSRP